MSTVTLHDKLGVQKVKQIFHTYKQKAEMAVSQSFIALPSLHCLADSN